MIEEEYISFETAKLAKGKGLDILCDIGYYIDSGVVDYIRDDYKNMFYPRPTQSLLARWLREKYDLSVEVYATASGFAWCVCKAHDGTYIVSYEDYDEDVPDAYEASKEIALQEALELIKRGSIKKWKYRN